MAILTKSQLTTANSSSFPDNNSQLITPQVLRDFNQSVIDTLVDSLDTGSFANTGVSNAFTQANSFTSISASSFVSASNFVGDGSKLTNITSSVSLPILDEGIPQGNATSMNFTGSAISATIVGGTAVVAVNIEAAGFVSTASFNPFTQSVNQFTQSADTSINALNQSSASQQVSIDALNQFTASQSTASIVNSISSLNQFTQSAEVRLTNLETTSASLLIETQNLELFSASALTSINALNVNSASVNSSITQLNASSASQQVSINAINQATQSLQNRTGSYATTGSNTFSGNQIISGTFSVTDGNDARFTVGVNANDIVMRAGATSNISMSFGGDLAMFGDNVALRNSVGDASITIYNGTGVSQKAYSTKVTATGPSGSMLIADVQNNKTYITIGGIDENVYVEAPLRVNAPFTASLQQGYVWVGNASGVSSLVSTSSFIDTFVSGNLVTTASFNAYTSSNDQRVSSLEVNSASVDTSITNINSTTASLNTSITNINSATASLFTSASLALVTASFDTGSRNLTFTKGDTQTFSVNIPDVTGSTGDFVTTASFNSYTQSNDQRVSSLESNSASVNTSITNLNSATSSLFTSASLGLTTASISGINLTFTKGDGTQFTIQVATGSFAVSASYADTASLATNALDIVVNAKNTTGAQLNKGTVVRIIGATGDNPLIGTASWTDDTTSANTLGFVVTDIPNDSFGRVMTQGTLLSVNTDPALGYTAGQLIYLSSSGQFTNVAPPAPYHEVRLGQVLRAQQNNGSIYVLVQNGYELSELHDVDINTGSLANNDLLAYNSASGQWENKTLTQVGATTTASFNSYTSSNDQRVSSLEAATGSYATTGSNNFNGNQTITGSLYVSSSSTSDVVIEGQLYISSSATGATTAPRIIVSGSQGQTTIQRNQFQTRNLTYLSTISPLVLDNTVLATADSIGMAVSSSAAGVAGWNLGPSIYVNNDPGDTYPAVFGFQNKANYTDGRVAVLTPLSASAGFTASLQNGYAWVGNSLGQNTQVATSSFGTPINTGSFATTGSNTFIGDQIITGSVTISSSAATDLAITGAAKIVSENGLQINTLGSNTFNLNTTKDASVNAENYIFGSTASVSSIYVGVYDDPNFTTDVELKLSAASGGISFNDWDNVDGAYESWLTLAPNVGTNPIPAFTRGLSVTGSTNIQNLTASLQQGYVWVGDSTGRTTTVATSSFATNISNLATTGSNTFIGTESISGSLIITGSAYGNVVSMSITSNTASMDLSQGNYFELTSSTTPCRINLTNLSAGLTATLIISASASSSILFSTNVAQPSGSAYSGSAGSIDILSFVAFNSSKANVVATKALI